METNKQKDTLRLLVTGASGYLGQHILSYWMTHGPGSSVRYEVIALVHQSDSLKDLSKIPCHERVTIQVHTCDLTSSDDLKNLLAAYPKTDENPQHFDICIHTAALSSPRVCQQDPSKAMAVNCPKLFFDCIQKIPLIALSTDQVYDGKKNVVSDGPYVEDQDLPNPLHVYGSTKQAMEEYLQKSRAQSATVVLRSSIILGPKAPIGKAHDTFLHFCHSRSREDTTFFTNEYRTVVGVQHVCKSLDWMVDRLTGSSQDASYQVFHLGGPVPVNRYEMASAVFSKFGFDSKHVLEANQTSTTSPLDISMDSSKLAAWTGMTHEPSTIEGIVDATFS